MPEEFKNKVVVITGGGGILCSTMAEALAREGARIAMLDLKTENAVKVAAKINASGGKAMAMAADV